MSKSFSLFLMLALISFNHANAQGDFWKTPAAYLGQPLPGDKPVRFAGNLLGVHGSFPLDKVLFSPDGKAFYYATNNTWFDSKNLKMYTFIYDGHQWKGPVLFNEHYYAPNFFADGKSMYFSGGMKSGGIWKIRQTDTGWSQPEEYLRRSYSLYNFIETASGTKYVGSNGTTGNIRDYSTYDISSMPASLADTSVQSLGIPINTNGFEGDFFVSSDESYIILSAKETKDFECELYISFHKPDGHWTNPKSLGPKINNGIAHRWGEYVTPDNKFLFFSHGTSPKDCWIYWVRFDRLLDQLKHSNFEPYLLIPIPDQSAHAGQPLQIKIPETTFVDDDGKNELSYAVTLDLHKPLPDWLKFDPKLNILSSTAAIAGIYPLTVWAKDKSGAAISTKLILNVNR